MDPPLGRIVHENEMFRSLLRKSWKNPYVLSCWQRRHHVRNLKVRGQQIMEIPNYKQITQQIVEAVLQLITDLLH